MKPTPLPWTVVAVLLCACSKDPPAPTSQAAATATITAASTASAAPKASALASAARAMGAASLPVSKGKSTFLIDAPKEKIKGQAEDVKGSISLDPADLSKTQGEVHFKLTTLSTTTFGKPKDDAAQSEHARNWMQVGPESKAEDRAKYEWATFKVLSVEAAPSKLADVKEEGGARTIKGKVTGDFTLHGVTSKKTIPFTATVRGPADKPTGVTLKTDTPFDVSMKEHDIKPRDAVGSFLNGALEKIGQKIDDRIQVSLEVTAGS